MDIQLDIENTIRSFTKTDDYKMAGKELFRSIVGAKLISIDYNFTPEEFIKEYTREDIKHSTQEKVQKLFTENTEKIHITNQLTEETIKEPYNIERLFNNSCSPELTSSYMYSFLFVIVLMKPDSYLKDRYKKITKRINRCFNAPAFILFYRQKDNNHFISLSFIGRRLHKNKYWADVVNRKVPILFNIDCAYPHQEYVERVSNLHVPTLLKEQLSLEGLMEVWLKILNLNISSDYSIRREIRRKRGQKLLALYYSQNKEGTL